MSPFHSAKARFRFRCGTILIAASIALEVLIKKQAVQEALAGNPSGEFVVLMIHMVGALSAILGIALSAYAYYESFIRGD